jgi:hypothetical protein
MGGEEFDVAGYLFGLLALGYILAVSVTRSPTLGLF